MVYLKTVFRASQSVLAAALPGRTPGAINTRYSTKLKDGQIPLWSAIECLEKSPEFRRYLNPARHNPILAQLPAAPVAGPAQPLAPSGIAMANPLPSSSKAKPRHAPLANLSFKNLSATEDESSDHSHSAASGRERERRTRKAVNYNVKAYFSGTNLDQDNEPSDEVAPVVQAPPVHSGTEGIPILPKIPKSQRSYKYAKSYLARHERKFLRQGLDAGTWDGKELREWSGTSIHIGLSAQEIKGLQEVALGVFGLENPEYSDVRPSKRRMEAIMKNATEAEILEIAAVAAQRKSLPDRSKESVEAALRDAQDGCLDESTLTLDDFKLTTPTVGPMVRHRELGKQYIRTNMKTKVFDTMGPSISFTGTSNDLNTVAWAPNGVQFAAGSTCHVDYDSMQYNRPNNLLFGSMNDKSLQELPEHHTLREKPASGPNSQHSMHVTQDRRLFQTVASVCFSPDGRSMYSAGYDGMVRFWDVKESGARQRLKMWRNAKVDLLAVSKTGMLATAAQRTSSHTITVFDPEQSEDLERWSISSFTSRKAAECPENKIYPSTIRFDPYDGDYLLAGFASTSREDQLRGESCLWNVNTGTQLHLFPETRNVFDVAWNPTRVNAPTFAVGCVAGTNVNRGVRSVVKMYDPRSAERCMSAVELDCPALDMNDVMFCPFDDNYIVAGCTNGRTYVWDLRQTHKELCLYSLVHGNPLIELADPASRERLDTGIRFCSWGHDRRRFYTGSSDGVIKSWDLYRAPEDTFIRDVVQLNSGVMCGSFSPDYSSLLLGEVNGSINVLEVGNDDRSIRDADSFDLISAPSDVKKPKAAAGPEDADSGVVASRNLVETSQMTLAPMGGFPVRQALQGWNYAGPFDLAMDAEDLRDQAAAFQRKLASGIGDTCTIKGCNDFKKFTEEECVDSGRWKDRIPAALTLWREPEDSAKTGGRQKSSIGAVPQLKCSEPGCGRRALLRSEYSDLLGQELEFPSCELHHFGCLRCGERNNLRQTTLDAPGDCGQSKKDDAAARFIFWHCDIYRADVLGYKRIPDPRLDLLSGPRCNRRVGAGEEKLLSRRGRRLVYSNDPDAEAEEDDDDDDNGVDEHYAGLWGLRDAPPAPPFLPQTPPPPSSSSSSSSAPPSPSQARRAATATAVAVVIPSTSHGKPSSAPLLSSSSSPPPQGNGAQQSNGGGAVCGSGSRGSDALAVAANEGPKSVEQVVGDADLGRPLAGSPRMEAQRQAQLQSQRSRGPALSTETIEAVEARAEANARAHARATGRALSVEILAGVRAHARAQAVANSVHAGRTHLQQVTEREQEPQYFGVRVGVCGPDAMELDFDSTMPMPADTATRVDSDALDHINAPRNGDQAAQLVSGMASAAAPFANTNASSVSTSADALSSKSLKTTTTAAAATAATSPVQTVEVEGPSINNVNDMDDGNEDENGDEKAKKKQRRPSSAASSQQSASSGDSNKSRTPCVPM
ncbi:hypothetical protein HDK90DRAFT_483794 [Phyllosticta capitalensis]|uniref:Uncharacterized protein n=2 Tax=Phyllosticta capitalensis TaxID=121624 RepID=A0ABR1YP69_9PEZI